MDIITGTTDFFIEEETAVAIGKFDGVHIGHRRLLEEILAKKADGLLACVFTFDPSPAVFFKKGDGKELCTKEEKRLLLERVGIDLLVEFPLNEISSRVSAEKFVSGILVGQMNAGFVAAGRDLSFGEGGKGDSKLLQKMAEEYDLTIKLIDKVRVEEGEVSSTLIRGFVERGEMALCEKCMGIPYPVIGKVVHGNRIGRTIGFPTVNLVPGENKLLPPSGVYLSDVVYQGRKYRGISNVGSKPTVSEHEKKGVETYIMDFDREIYDEEIEIYLKKFRRPEQKFGSLKELQEQLKRDCALAE